MCVFSFCLVGFEVGGLLLFSVGWFFLLLWFWVWVFFIYFHNMLFRALKIEAPACSVRHL